MQTILGLLMANREEMRIAIRAKLDLNNGTFLPLFFLFILLEGLVMVLPCCDHLVTQSL